MKLINYFKSLRPIFVSSCDAILSSYRILSSYQILLWLSGYRSVVVLAPIPGETPVVQALVELIIEYVLEGMDFNAMALRIAGLDWATYIYGIQRGLEVGLITRGHISEFVWAAATGVAVPGVSDIYIFQPLRNVTKGLRTVIINSLSDPETLTIICSVGFLVVIGFGVYKCVKIYTASVPTPTPTPVTVPVSVPDLESSMSSPFENIEDVCDIFNIIHCRFGNAFYIIYNERLQLLELYPIDEVYTFLDRFEWYDDLFLVWGVNDMTNFLFVLLDVDYINLCIAFLYGFMWMLWKFLIYLIKKLL